MGRNQATKIEIPCPVVETDGGRRFSKRPKQDNDCTVVSLAVALGMPYDIAYDICAKAGRKSNHGMFFDKYLDRQRWCQRRKFQDIPFSRFFEKNLNENHILWVRTPTWSLSHMVTVKDGVLWDSLDGVTTAKSLVHMAWKVLWPRGGIFNA